MENRYRQTLDYLYTRLPMFSHMGQAAFKKDLDNIRRLCSVMGQPQEKFKSIHIAGTNGKGSVSHMLSAALQQAGYKTGLYTSPHLVDFRERIRLNGQPVSIPWICEFVDAHREHIENIAPSFFEITVAMAFAAFAEAQVDVAIIETGLGGRLDSTNIITPILSVITNISYDHKDMLGDTLAAIATEKAGIIKPKIPVLIGEQHDETERIFFEHALRLQSPIYYAGSAWDLVKTGQDIQRQIYKAVHNGRRAIYDLQTDMTGNYQSHNIKTVLAATEILDNREDMILPLAGVLQALSHVKELTGLRGRWDILQQQPLIIADVAHNPAGLQEVVRQWKNTPARNKYILISFVRDKDINAALACLPKEASYYFTQAQIPRALPASELEQIAGTHGLKGTAFLNAGDALKAALSAMTNEDALLITGSFFVIGELIPELERVIIE